MEIIRYVMECSYNRFFKTMFDNSEKLALRELVDMSYTESKEVPLDKPIPIKIIIPDKE